MDCINPGHKGAGATCAGCAREAEREVVSLRDRLQRMFNDQREHAKRTEAAARRDAQDHMRAFTQLMLGSLMDELTFPVRPALYRATQIDPERARTVAERTQLGQLRNAAETALKAWDERTSRDVLAAGFAADPLETEIARLRGVIEHQGKRLHRELAPPFDGHTACTCPGCELIRAMDAGTLDVDGPEAEAS